MTYGDLIVKYEESAYEELMDSLARFKSSFVDENTVVMTKIQSILSGWFEESESRQAELHLQEELQRRQEELKRRYLTQWRF